ncbi:MAG: hypothetical protein GKR93_17035 [Gammaproteobacteria bacterium]|nr:hypothetical protein [Gammaproteobacteria bacterium]
MQSKYEFDDQAENATTPPSLKNWPETFVRCIGMLLLIIGLWAGLHVILESLSLYRDPLSIEQLAQAIERGSHIDQTLSADTNASISKTRSQTDSRIQLSYFIAWVVALLLLLLISMMAFSCIQAGSDLLIQDRSLKRYLAMTTKQSLIKTGSP